MAVIIGHASKDEKGNSKGGGAGDQTKREVYTCGWYTNSARPWLYVLRPDDSVVAEKIAKAMEQACVNDYIGYDQNQRTTLYVKAKAFNWDISKITTACECDCSSLVAVCVNAAGVSVSKDIYTGNQKEALTSTGAFTLLTGAKYTNTSDYLKRGDILLMSGHTAIVLSDGAKVANGTTSSVDSVGTQAIEQSTKIDSAKNYMSTFKAAYVVSASMLNVRSGAGLLKKILVTIPKGTKVRCYGYYTRVLGTDWLYVQFTYNNITYTGFVSSKYLAKK
jgi:hypothetical protein